MQVPSISPIAQDGDVSLKCHEAYNLAGKYSI